SSPVPNSRVRKTRSIAMSPEFASPLVSPPLGISSPLASSNTGGLFAPAPLVTFLSCFSRLPALSMPRYTHRLPSTAFGSLTLPRQGAVGESACSPLRYVTLYFVFTVSGIGNEIAACSSTWGCPAAALIETDHPPCSCALGLRCPNEPMPCAFSPRCPVGPVAPLSPFSPRDPVGPVAPVAPVGPVGPVAPFSPGAGFSGVGPVGPVAPFGPVGPVAPVTPPAPVAPFSPVGPVGPVGPLPN